MKKLFGSSILASCVFFLSTVSFANDYTKPGLFFGVGGSIIAENFDTGIDNLDFDQSAGFNVKFGYRLNDHFEGEIDYIMIDSFDGTVSNVKMLELTGYAVTVSGKWYPLIGKVQPYCLVGVGYADLEISDTLGLNISESESDFIFRAGGGLDVYLAENALVFAELSYYFTHGDIDDTDFIPFTVGIKYKF